ncbi:MAG TPA: TonB-dependent receptor [Bacteroidetes bacterium]|nr:TonB-dependent receptor [Bacteroidota bacterium]
MQDSSYTRRGRITVNTRYRITDRLSVGINSNFNRTEGKSFFFWQDIDNLYRPGSGSLGRGSENLRYNIDPFVTYFDKNDNRHKFLGRFFNVDNQGGTAAADQSNVSQVYYGEYQFQRKMEGLDLMLTAGAVYNGTRVRAPLYGDTTFVNNNLAGYLQLEKKFFGRLNVSAGFRYEDNTLKTPDSLFFESDRITYSGSIPGGKIKESKPVLRIGASYEVGPGTFFRASLGQGYRFPTIAEKFIFTEFGSLPIIPNFDLESETGWTAELGVRKGFHVNQFVGFLDASTFWSEYNNMMEFTFGTSPLAFQSQNIGDTRIKGFEVSINGRGSFFGLETTLLAGYTYIDPKFKEFGLDLPEGSRGLSNARNSSVCPANCKNILKYRYKHTAKFDMEMKYKRASFGVALLYTSFMENIDAAFESPFLPIGLKEFREEHNSGDLILNLRAAYHFTEGIKASFLVDNVGNREYISRPGKLNAPRGFTLRMDFDF